MILDSWITWALQGLLGFFLWIVWSKLDETSKEVHALALKLSDEYVKKSDPIFATLVLLHDRIRELEEWMHRGKALASQLERKPE